MNCAMAQIRIRMRCFSRVCRRRNAIKKESQIRLRKENGARKKGWCQRSIEPTGRAAPFFYLGARAAEPLSTPARGLRPVKILLTWLPVWAPGSDGCSVTRKPLAGQADYGRPARLLGPRSSSLLGELCRRRRRCEGKTDDRKCLERAARRRWWSRLLSRLVSSFAFNGARCAEGGRRGALFVRFPLARLTRALAVPALRGPHNSVRLGQATRQSPRCIGTLGAENLRNNEVVRLRGDKREKGRAGFVTLARRVI